MKLNNKLTCLFRRGEGVKSASPLPSSVAESEETVALYKSYGLYLNEGGGINLAASISAELASLTMTEFSLEVRKGRGEIIPCIDSLKERLKRATEYACATGGVIFKPIFDGRSLSVQTVLPFDFIPLGADMSGKLNECAFIYRAEQGGRCYTRIEEHRKTDGGYVITNRAYEGEGESPAPCELSSVTAWADISPRVEIESLSRPLFAYFPMPFGNPRFPRSPLGAPVFRRAEEIIREADKQYRRLLWEFEGGELAIDASEDAFRLGKDGKPRLPEGKERLYRTNALDACCSSNELLKTFAPELRDKSLINGLNRLIMLVEDACGIARGTFSDPADIAKTATEVRSMRERTYTTVSAIRHSLENALAELFEAIKALCALYFIDIGDAELDIKLGNGVLSDGESERNASREDVKFGIITPEEYKKRWYR